MGLDFSVLDNIPVQLARRDFPEPIGQEEEIQAEELDTALKGAAGTLQRLKKDTENTRQMYATYQQNIRRAGELRSDIAKEIRDGEDPLDILLKALECISLMTGDTVTYTQEKKDIQAVYGWGMGQPEPLREELEEAEKRLALLTRPELLTPDTPPDTQRRIQKAIEAHRRKIIRLESALAGKGA